MTTVVSAYYKMQSKCSHDTYMNWINNFMHLECDMVFYTDQETLADLRESARLADKKNIIFTVAPKNEWVAYTKYGEDFWQRQKTIDTDNTQAGPMHSPDLYCVWYEKKHFVLRTIESNPYDSEYFIWCDAGAVRESGWLDDVKKFGCNTIKIKSPPRDKIVLLNIKPYTTADMEHFNMHNVMPSNKDLIGGGIQGAYHDMWQKWSDIYDAKLQEMNQMGKFVGKDQDILNILAITEPTVVCVVCSNTSLPDRWFTLLYLL
jgi:hypothetical protein